MATKKTSSRPKTNTSKPKKATKPAANSRSTKPATKTAAKATASSSTRARSTKASRAATTKKTSAKKTKLTDNQMLRRLNWLSLCVHLLGALIAALLMSSYVQQVFAGFVARDELASVNDTVFVPAIHHLYDVQLMWLVVAVLLLGAIMPLVQLRQRGRYEQRIKQRANPLRWADKAIVSGAMLSVVAALSGVQDFMTLKVIGGLIVVTAMLGWLSERQNADPKAKPDYSAFGISLVSGALPWLIILGYAFATPLWGMIRYPWYVYALHAVVFIGSAAYAINGYNYVRRFRNWVNYAVVERNYLIIDVATRLSFAIVLIVGFSK